MWTEHVLPRLVDASLRGQEVGELRAQACRRLSGRVLEIGFGSGLNVRWYPPEVAMVSAVEPSDVGWAMSERRREQSQVPAERSGLDGQRLDEPDGSFDCVLSTFTLCTIPDVAVALEEVRRVLRPEGTFHVLEHGLAPDKEVARWQRRLEPVQKRIAGGCHLTRDMTEIVEAAGFTLDEAERAYLPGPKAGRPWAYLSRLLCHA